MTGIHWWPVNSPHNWPVTRKLLPFDDAIMIPVIGECGFLLYYSSSLGIFPNDEGVNLVRLASASAGPKGLIDNSQNVIIVVSYSHIILASWHGDIFRTTGLVREIHLQKGHMEFSVLNKQLRYRRFETPCRLYGIIVMVDYGFQQYMYASGISMQKHKNINIFPFV